MPKRPFTTKQQRFIDFYDGNATDAARRAGYKGNDNTLAQVGDENLRKPKIAAAIKNRETKRNKKHIASREERQEFWTNVLLGENIEPVIIGYNEGGDAVTMRIPPKMTDRLKASELLGRSEADFTDKKLIEAGKSFQDVLKEIHKDRGNI